jgi:hypothetical protein
MDRRYPEPSGRGLNPVLRAPLLEAIERALHEFEEA